MLWEMLATFVLRLSFGTAFAMAITPASLVTGGFYRVHLWMLLGFNTFAALAAGSHEFGGRPVFAMTVAAAIVSYIGAVIWMYEKRSAGIAALVIVGLLDLAASLLAVPAGLGGILSDDGILDVLTSGLLLGLVMTAMLLGHWYLNTPSMKLGPLKRLILAILVLVVIRSVVCGVGLTGELLAENEARNFGWYSLLWLRWLSGIFGVLFLGVMTWQTLKIPNTQSATGILYVAVMFSFLGELSSQLLSASATYPL